MSSNTPKTWADLNRRQREKVLYMFGALEEFRFGVHQLGRVSETEAQGSTPHRFLAHALYFYTASFFIVRHRNLLQLLQEIGHDDVAKPALEILDRPLAGSSLREVLREYRNKFLSHPGYSYEEVQGLLKPRVDLTDQANRDLLAERNEEFQAAIVFMAVPLSQRLPEAFGITAL